MKVTTMFLILSILHIMNFIKNTLSSLFRKTVIRLYQKHALVKNAHTLKASNNKTLNADLYGQGHISSGFHSTSSKELCLTDLYSRSATYFYCNSQTPMGGENLFLE